MGLIQDPRPSLHRGVSMEDLVEHVYVDGVAGLSQNGTIAIGRIRDPVTRVVAELVVRVVGSSAPERIGAGMILMVKRAIAGT